MPVVILSSMAPERGTTSLAKDLSQPETSILGPTFGTHLMAGVWHDTGIWA